MEESEVDGKSLNQLEDDGYKNDNFRGTCTYRWKNGEKYVVYDYIFENRDQLKRIPPNGRVVKRESNKIDDIKIKGILGMEI